MSSPEANRSSSKVCRFCGSAITVTSLVPSRDKDNGSAQYRSATLRGTNFSTLSWTVADPQSTYRRPVTCSRAATRSSLDTRPRPSRRLTEQDSLSRLLLHRAREVVLGDMPTFLQHFSQFSFSHLRRNAWPVC